MKSTCASVYAGVVSLLVLTLAVPVLSADKVLVGKNPGETKGRWLEVGDPSRLKEYKKVFLGEIQSDIRWKKQDKETPVDEQMLNDKIREHVLLNLRQSRLFGEVLDAPPSGMFDGIVRIDAELVVEAGNRAARYFVGMGAGKSQSILELHLRDHATGESLGRYHGYGAGTGMAFKVGGGGARKMTQDDIQENAKRFAELLREVL